MKYIKLYEEIDNESEISQTLKEICLELEDDDYTITTKGLTGDYKYFFAIRRYTNDGKDHQKLEFSEIKEYLLRIKDYLGKNYVGFRWYNGGAWKRHVVLDNNTNVIGSYIFVIEYISKYEIH